MYLLYVGEGLDGSTMLDPYLTANVAGSWQLSECWGVFGRVDNLFDEDYEEVRGFGTLRLSFYAGAEVEW